MKILITGSFCSGKTTLAELLHAALPGSRLLYEPVRDLAGVFEQAQIAQPQVRDYLLVRQLYIEAAAERTGGDIICDAGVESNLAHSRLFGHPAPAGVLQRFGHVRYDMVFFCDHEQVKIDNDGFRFTDKVLQTELAERLSEVLRELVYEPRLLKGTPVERCEKALSHLSNLKEVEGGSRF